MVVEGAERAGHVMPYRTSPSRDAVQDAWEREHERRRYFWYPPCTLLASFQRFQASLLPADGSCKAAPSVVLHVPFWD